MSNSIKIKKGKVLVYRVFDVGDDIDLEMASRILEQSSSPLRFRLKRESRAMVIKNAPLLLSLGNWEHNFIGQQAMVESVGKLWHFGVFSICFSVTIPEDTSWNRLMDFAAFLENDTTLDQMARQKTHDLMVQISSVIKNRNVIFDFYEDYVVHFLESIEGIDSNSNEIFKKANVHGLILAETKDRDTLSDQVKLPIEESTFQYTNNDLAVIDWNSALVIEPTGSMDVPDVIEFALCQLLEMRYYDDVLDDRLASLYDSVGKKKKGFMSNLYSNLAEEAGEKYLEISELIENVENSMKVVGDFYLAKIFRAALNRFRFRDWQVSVDNKLNNLAEVSKLLHGEVSETRSTIMELIIIFLIAVEVVPLLWTVFQKMIS